MTLRVKMMSITALILIGLFGLLYLATEAILLDSFARLEQKEISEDIQRVVNAFTLKLNALAATTKDWSSWDDTYRFVQNDNDDFVGSNLLDSVFTGLALNVMVFTDKAGQLVYSRGFDLSSDGPIPISANLAAYLKPESPLIAPANDRMELSGILALPEGPLLLISEPILTSVGLGPVAGRLLFGQYLNKQAIEQISANTLIPLEIYGFDDKSAPDDVVRASKQLTAESPLYTQPLSEDVVAGYAVLNGIFNQPEFIVRTSASRYIFHQGQISLSYLLAALLLAGVVCCAIVLWVLDRYVLGRMARLGNTLAIIRGKKDRSIRVRVEGKDELSDLAHGFNETLDALEQSSEILHTNQELLAKVFDSVPVAIAIMTLKDSRILNVNHYFPELIGYTADELINHSVGNIGYWASMQQRNDLIAELRQNGHVNAKEALWKTKSGETLDMLISMQPIEVSGEACVLGIGVDITERKRTEQEKLEANQIRLDLEKEREVIELKERFISTMSHEFRTPLAIIQSSKETLQHYFDRMTPERRLAKLVTIGEQIGLIVELLDEFLTISKARAGKLEFSPRSLNLVTFCQQLSEQIQTVDKSLHHFVFTSHGDLSEVYGDERLLQHIVVNLLSNAIKYSPEGGEVRVELTRDENEAVLQVSDQGIGIPQDDQKHLFEAFYRATNTQAIQGTGLGLAIVKESVDVHGGTIDCESAAGKGTTFTVRLPIYHPEQQKQLTG